MTGDCHGTHRPLRFRLPSAWSRRKPGRGGSRTHKAYRHLIGLVALTLMFGAAGPADAANPEGQLTWGVHISLAPTWFEPAETPGMITPYMVMYALHDAMLKPMPGQPLAPTLAESGTPSQTPRTYD